MALHMAFMRYSRGHELLDAIHMFELYPGALPLPHSCVHGVSHERRELWYGCCISRREYSYGLCVNQKRGCAVRLYYGCRIKGENKRVSSSFGSSHLLPASWLVPCLFWADSGTQGDSWRHEQDRQDMCFHTKRAQRFLKLLIVLRMRVFCSLLLGYDLNNEQCLAKL